MFNKSIITVLLTFVCVIAYSQQFSSSVQTKDGEVSIKERTISITDSEITISNYLNGGSDPLNIKVDRTEEKESWEASGIATWYYGTAVGKKWVIILSLRGSIGNMYVHQILDEVNNIPISFNLTKE